MCPRQDCTCRGHCIIGEAAGVREVKPVILSDQGLQALQGRRGLTLDSQMCGSLLLRFHEGFCSWCGGYCGLWRVDEVERAK